MAASILRLMWLWCSPAPGVASALPSDKIPSNPMVRSHHKSDKVFLSESFQCSPKNAGQKRVVIHMYGGWCICIFWWVEGKNHSCLKRFFVPKVCEIVGMKNEGHSASHLMYIDH
jgi:hypothetical protein